MVLFEEFKNDVVDKLEELSCGKFGIRMASNLKNNGIRLTGVMAVRDNANISPTVYLDGYYADYTSGNRSVDEIVENVYEILCEKSEQVGLKIDMQDFIKWDNVKHNVYSKVINASMNTELLQQIPHRIIMDLAEVYYVDIGYSEKMEGIGTVQIFNNHAKVWGVDEDELNRIAHENMGRNEACIRRMCDIINGYMGISMEDMDEGIETSL